MPPKKTIKATVTEQTTVHILYSTDSSGTIAVEIALVAPDVKKFLEKIRLAGDLHLIQEFMVATGNEIELEDLEDAEPNELYDMVTAWLEDTSEFGVTSFKLRI